MKVDAHAHIWKAAPDYPDPAVTILSPASEVTLDLLKLYMDESGVGRAVLVQPLYPGEDNSLVADAAQVEPDRFAAVVVVLPRFAAAAERLEYWVRERGCRGLRLRPSFPGEIASFANPEIWRKARELRTVVSILARPEHVPAIGLQARQYPEVPVIVDHLAHPDVAAGVRAAPFQSLLGLASCPNVFLKPTGFYYYSKRGYPYDDCGELFRAAYDRFGPDRLIWGSDFPHVLLRGGYGRHARLFEERFPFVGPAEREKIQGGNAERLYWPPA